MKKLLKIIGYSISGIVALIVLAIIILSIIIFEFRSPSKATINELKNEFGNAHELITENHKALELLKKIQQRMIEFNSINEHGYSVYILTISNINNRRTPEITGSYFDAMQHIIDENDISICWINIEETEELCRLLNQTQSKWCMITQNSISLYYIEGKENTNISIETPLKIKSNERHDNNRCVYSEECEEWWIALLVRDVYN